ncbi:MAG: glucose 1-dehydrogenase, partial [Chloroflexota bacterium]
MAGKTAIITGSASGIGEGIAQHFAHQGAAVVIDYVGHADEAAQVVQRIEAAGGRALAVSADVSRQEDVQHLVAQAVSAFGALHVMVNNAGIEHQLPFVDTALDVFRETIAVNLEGVWLGCQAAAKQMIAQGSGGRVINISSIHEEVTMPGNAAYCASKGGVMMLMRTIAVELAPHHITVNNIAPGAVRTPIDAATMANPSKLAALLHEIPLGRMGEPAEIARLAAFLASDDAAYVTGSTYFI